MPKLDARSLYARCDGDSAVAEEGPKGTEGAQALLFPFLSFFHAGTYICVPFCRGKLLLGINKGEHEGG